MKILRLVSLLCLLIADSFAADVLPDERKPVSWTPGTSVGVAGGIPSASWSVVDVTTLGVATGNDAATNQSAIDAAIVTYNGTNTVLYFPAGTYQVNSTTVGGSRSGVTLRGAGMFETFLVQNSGIAAFTFGSDPGFSQPMFNPTGTVLSGFTRGSTSITVQNSENGVNFRSGEMIYCSIPNDPAIPVLQYGTGDTGLVDHMNYVTTATNNGDGTFTLTLSVPVARDYAGTITVNQPQPGLNTAKRVGIEDLTINCNSVAGRNGVQFTAVTDSWAKNVRVINADNYPFSIYNSVSSTITGCFAAESIGWGSSHGGIAVYSNCNGILVEDNIIIGNYSGIIVQTTVNSAISHNFIYRCPVALSPNHASFPHHNVYEGNIAPNSNTDGTHGGTGTSTFHANWFMGVDDDYNEENGTSSWNTTTGLLENATPVYGFSAKRWTVKYSLIKNIFGTPGYTEPTQAISLDGQPNLGNGMSNGFGTYGGAAATLSARSADDAGTVTAPSGHGITTGSTVDVYWGSFDGLYHHSHIRRSMTVGTVSGTDIPVSGGFGDALPALSSAVFVPTENTAIRTYPQDFDGTNFRPHRWTATVVSKDLPTSLVMSVSNDVSPLSVAQDRVIRAITYDGWNSNRATFRIIGYQTATISTPMSGSNLTFDGGLGPWFDGITVGATVTLDPSSAGFQELDLDVRRTTLTRGNRTYLGTLILDDLQVGETSPASYIYPTTPQFVTGYGSLPIFDADSPGTLSVRRLPAGDRYMTFLDNGSFDSGSVSTPQFSPSPGTHASGTELTITSSTSAATIYVTLDGSTPTTSSTLYTGPIPLPDGVTEVKAIAVKAEMTDSAVQSGTYTLVTAPTAPSGLGATAVSSSQINLAWTDNSSTETGFRIERRVGAGSWGTVTTTAANATSYSNTGLTASTTYEYRVYAVNVAGDSTASNTASATTDSEGGGAANATINQLNVGTLAIP